MDKQLSTKFDAHANAATDISSNLSIDAHHLWKEHSVAISAGVGMAAGIAMTLAFRRPSAAVVQETEIAVERLVPLAHRSGATVAESAADAQNVASLQNILGHAGDERYSVFKTADLPALQFETPVPIASELGQKTMQVLPDAVQETAQKLFAANPGEWRLKLGLSQTDGLFTSTFEEPKLGQSYEFAWQSNRLAEGALAPEHIFSDPLQVELSSAAHRQVQFLKGSGFEYVHRNNPYTLEFFKGQSYVDRNNPHTLGFFKSQTGPTGLFAMVRNYEPAEMVGRTSVGLTK